MEKRKGDGDGSSIYFMVCRNIAHALRQLGSSRRREVSDIEWQEIAGQHRQQQQQQQNHRHSLLLHPSLSGATADPASKKGA